MNISIFRFLRITALSCLLISLSGCEDPQVYGSIGVSSYGGGYGGGGYYGRGGPGMHSSVSIGGRIY